MALTDFERRIRRDQGNIKRESRFADYQEGLQGQLDRQGAARMSARERRLAENAQIARGDPGRFSSFERNALLGMQHTKSGDIAYVDRQERRGLQAHEMNMLKQQGENEIAKERERAGGLRDQGMTAAGINANAKLTEAELRFGRFGQNGEYVPGSDVHAAQASGLSRAEVERIRGENRLSVAESNNSTKRDIAEGQNATKKEISQSGNETKTKIAEGRNKTKVQTTQIRADAATERTKQREAEAEQRAFDNWTNTALDVAKGVLTPAERTAFQSMSPDERRQFWIKKTGRKGLRGAEAANQDGKAENQGNGGNWKGALGW